MNWDLSWNKKLTIYKINQMKVKFLLILLIAMCYSSYSQEWSSRITLMERHLEENNMTVEKQQLKLFPELNDNLFSILSFHDSKNKIKAGIHLIIEEDMPESEMSIQDFFMYSLGVVYAKNSFNITFNVENFMNLFDNNFDLHQISMRQLSHQVLLHQQFLLRLYNHIDRCYF